MEQTVSWPNLSETSLLFLWEWKWYEKKMKEIKLVGRKGEAGHPKIWEDATTVDRGTARGTHRETVGIKGYTFIFWKRFYWASFLCLCRVCFVSRFSGGVLSLSFKKATLLNQFNDLLRISQVHHRWFWFVIQSPSKKILLWPHHIWWIEIFTGIGDEFKCYLMLLLRCLPLSFITQ